MPAEFAKLRAFRTHLPYVPKCLRALRALFKIVNNQNPYYMKEIFSKTTNLTHRPPLWT